MSLDELMEVWRSQDAAPLHGVNETLLRLALRQDEAKLQASRRVERRVIYVMSAVFVAVMVAFCLFIVTSDKLTGWDFAIPIVGTAAALLRPGALRVSYRAQARREQRFGESLRDQLNRHIAQLDYHARRVDSLAYHLVSNLPTMVWWTAVFFAILRINEKPFIDAGIWVGIVGTIFVSAIVVPASVWVQRRTVKRQLLPHKRRLEALLKELDAP
jgi:O-antigen/teichoic acid export membrane protein